MIMVASERSTTESSFASAASRQLGSASIASFFSRAGLEPLFQLAALPAHLLTRFACFSDHGDQS